MERAKKENNRKASLKTLIEKNPLQKCLFITLIAAICIMVGFIFKNPLIMVVGLLPASLYEAYRTFGFGTKIASVLLFIILFLEIILIIFNINIDLAKILGVSKKYIAGYGMVLVDIKVLIPLLIVFLSVILLVRTVGIYTKWLSIILIVGCFCVIYTLYPSQFSKLFDFAIKFFIRLMNS